MTKQQLLQGLKKTAIQRKNSCTGQTGPENKLVDCSIEDKEWSSRFNSLLKMLQCSPLPVI